MKKITLLIILCIGSLGFAQTLPYTFDESTDPSYYFTGFDINFQLTTDPDDATNAVGSITGNGSNFDTLQTIGLLAENIDLSDDNNNTITFKWRPLNGTGSGTHLLKFEGAGPVVELPFTSTGTAWQDISIDFGPGLGVYDNLIIFPDFNNAGNDVYLIDDLAGGTNVAPPPPPSAEFPIDFESADDTFICFDCGFDIVQDNGDNVGQIVGGGIEFDTAQLTLGTLLDLSDDANNTITFRIKPVNGTGSGSHLLKFEGGSGPITELPFTTTGPEWQDISIDFGAGLGTYSLVVLFTDFNNTASDTYLIDDIAGGTNNVPFEDPEAAPIPNASNGEVYSIYNDTNGYTTVFPFAYPFGTLGGEPDLDTGAGENKALKFDFNIAGYGQGEGGPDDVSAYNFVNFMYFAEPGIPGFQFRMISNNGGVTEHTYEIGTQEAVVTGQWTTVSIPMTYFTGIGFSSENFFQWKFDPFMQQTIQGGIVYIDNIILTLNALSVNEFDTAQFKAYPNPTKDDWNISSSLVINTIAIYDILGKKVLTLTPNASELVIDASTLNTGLYFAKVQSDNGSKTVKLIKQ